MTIKKESRNSLGGDYRLSYYIFKADGKINVSGAFCIYSNSLQTLDIGLFGRCNGKYIRMLDLRQSNLADSNGACLSSHISKKRFFKTDNIDSQDFSRGNQKKRRFRTKHQFNQDIDTFFHATAFAGGSLVRITENDNNWQSYKTEFGEIAKRGKITVFSSQSRRRMLKALNKINRTKISDKRILFLTLTAGGTGSNWQDVSGREWKKRINNWFTNLRSTKLVDGQFGIWRMEFQKRTIDGVRAVHFHVVLFNISYLCKDWVAKSWNRVVCKGLDKEISRKHLKAGTQVELARNWGNTQKYFSKTMAYLAKKEDSLESSFERMQNFGKHWGYIARASMTRYIDQVINQLSEKQYYAVRRMMLNLQKSKARQKEKYKIIKEKELGQKINGIQITTEGTWKNQFNKLRTFLLTDDKRNYEVFIDYKQWISYLGQYFKKVNIDCIHYKINEKVILV